MTEFGGICAKCMNVDFLPYECSLCHKIYCQLHIKHGCLSDDNTVNGNNEDDKYGFNTSGECDIVKCDYKTCDKRPFLPIKCKICHLSYCIEHRLHEKHR